MINTKKLKVTSLTNIMLTQNLKYLLINILNLKKYNIQYFLKLILNQKLLVLNNVLENKGNGIIKQSKLLENFKIQYKLMIMLMVQELSNYKSNPLILMNLFDK